MANTKRFAVIEGDLEQYFNNIITLFSSKSYIRKILN